MQAASERGLQVQIEPELPPDDAKTTSGRPGEGMAGWDNTDLIVATTIFQETVLHLKEQRLCRRLRQRAWTLTAVAASRGSGRRAWMTWAAWALLIGDPSPV